MDNLVEDYYSKVQAWALDELVNSSGNPAPVRPSTVEVANADSLLFDYEQWNETLGELTEQELNLFRLYQDSKDIVDRQMIYALDSIYRQIPTYNNFIELAATAENPQKYIRETITKIVSDGLKNIAVTTKNGDIHQWYPDTYFNLQLNNTRTSMINNMSLESNRQTGNKFMRISNHSGARPKCFPYQGKIVDPTDTFTGTINGFEIETLGSTTYGEPDGLFGFNCRHRMIPFNPEVISKDYRTLIQDETDNEEQYNATQKQRALERKLRDEKTKQYYQNLNVEGSGDKYNSRIQALEKQVDTLCTDAKITRRFERELPYVPD